jgi:signal transduction histidine kinase
MLQTLSARLTLLYLLLFAFLSMVVFGLVYYNLQTSLLKRIDDALFTDGIECLHIYKESGIEGIAHEIQLETGISTNEDMFMRLYSHEFETIASSDLKLWQPLIRQRRKPEDIRREPFQTIILNQHSGRARIFYQLLGDGYVLQFGKLLKADTQLLQKVRLTYSISFGIMLLCGVPLGLYIAKRALTGILNVQKGAEQVCRGDMSQRIAYSGGSKEILNLTQSFNHMQDRIQTLIVELKDVTNNVAHDLRSPITRMRGMAETTLTGDQSLEDYRDLAGVVVEESDRLVGMVNIMLEIAETDAGLRPLANDPVDIRIMIQDVTELFSSVAQDKRIHLTSDISAEELLLYGDRSRLQRALANVLDNSLKFTPQGGHVHVSADVVNRQIVVTVKDSGPGIPTNDLPRIFDRFYRGDQSRSTPGSGLGLTLVDSIVRAHGGRLKVVNVEPQGLLVEFSFP